MLPGVGMRFRSLTKAGRLAKHESSVAWWSAEALPKSVGTLASTRFADDSGRKRSVTGCLICTAQAPGGKETGGGRGEGQEQL